MVGKGSDVVGDGVGFGVDAGVFFVVWVGAGAKLGVEVKDEVCDGVVGVVGSGVDVGIGASEMSRLTLATSTSCVPELWQYQSSPMPVIKLIGCVLSVNCC